jgi:IMP cyclohydrolase
VETVDDLQSHLGRYPGRGLGLFLGPADAIRWTYFLTGRSAASRARRFRLVGDSLVVESTDESATHDPLRHYVCATLGSDGRLVVGNGQQVQHIASILSRGGSAEDAAGELEPEPDPPIYTPRISLVVGDDEAVSIAVTRGPDGDATRRVADATPSRGEMVVLHTYSGSLESPRGSAPEFRLPIDEVSSPSSALWSALDPDLRVMMCEGSSSSAVPTDWWGPASEPQ